MDDLAPPPPPPSDPVQASAQGWGTASTPHSVADIGQVYPPHNSATQMQYPTVPTFSSQQTASVHKGQTGAYDYSQYYAGYPPAAPYDYTAYAHYYSGHAATQTSGAHQAPTQPALQPTGTGAQPSYTAVPPPPSLMTARSGPSPHGPGIPMARPRLSVIRPNGAWGHAPMRNSPRAAPSMQVHEPTPSARPAYITVATDESSRLTSESKSGTQGIASPQNWPPALKAYVERAFKAASLRNRSKLQEVLRVIIGDAQKKGELWIRRWDTLPLPDLSQTAQDAASVIFEVIAMGDTGGYPSFQGKEMSWPAMSAPERRFANRPAAAVDPGAFVRREASGSRRLQSNERMVSAKKKRGWSSAEFSSDSDDYNTSSQGGPFAEDEDRRRARRAGRFKDGAADGVPTSHAPGAAARRARLSALLDDAGADGEQVDWDAFAIKGTRKNLEKSYFRLTSAPDPSSVRPEPVLRQALDRLTKLIASSEVNYFYAQDQFKGLRQDCVVQGLRGSLAVAVYEAHARAALEYGDIAEYNQCQGQLQVLYGESLANNNKNECMPEFLAYRLLYQTIHARHGEALSLLHTLRRIRTLSDVERLPAVAHAIRVRAALADGDHAAFFTLYANAPALGRALMDLAVPRVRFAALHGFIKAFKPTLPVDYIVRVLGFVLPKKVESLIKVRGKGRAGGGGLLGRDGLDVQHIGKKGSTVLSTAKEQGPLPGCANIIFEGVHKAQESVESGRVVCLEWLQECCAVVVGAAADSAVDCKASMGQLRMPEEKEKVAHGDANLDIGDFLKTFDE